jgi:hypothetical protein
MAGEGSVGPMPAVGASAPLPPSQPLAADAREAVSRFIGHLAAQGMAPSTLRTREHFLEEYLRHARSHRDDDGAPAERPAPLTAGELLDPARSGAWLADAAAGKTRTRNTIRGPQAAAYPNSMRVRADTFNAFAAWLGQPHRVDGQAPAAGYSLGPADAEKLLHDLAVRRPVTASAVTALRTAAVAALVASTGEGVPDLAGLQVSALRLDASPPVAEVGGQAHPLSADTVHILTRWLAARAAIIADLEGSDPGHLWIPVKPGRPRGGRDPVRPGIEPAAVRTLHHSHRALVSQLLGTPLRPGTLRAMADSALASTAPDSTAMDDRAGQA